MANKNTGTRTETRYEFDLSHDDIVSMMNDPNVLLQGGHVAANQIFNVSLKRPNGQEIHLKDMKAGDTLVFRFTTVGDVNSGATYTGVDVQS